MKKTTGTQQKPISRGPAIPETKKKVPTKPTKAVPAKTTKEPEKPKELEKPALVKPTSKQSIKKPIHKEEDKKVDKMQEAVKNEEILIKPKDNEIVEENQEDAPDDEQMMADIMGGFKKLNPNAEKKPGKTDKQKLPFIPSLEHKTSKEIIKELSNTKDNKLILSLLRGLHEHNDLPKEEKINYLEQEAKLSIELGHSENGVLASEAILELDPYNLNGNYYLLLVFY